MVEMIIVVVILGILGTFTFRFLTSTAEIYQLTVQQDKLYNEVWVAMEKIVRELQAATSGSVAVTATSVNFTKDFVPSNMVDKSTSITFSLVSGILRREGTDIRTLATGITDFTVTNTSNLITIEITKMDGTNSFSLRSQVYPSSERFPSGTGKGHWEEVIS